jgi:hypothetical protein
MVKPFLLDKNASFYTAKFSFNLLSSVVDVKKTTYHKSCKICPHNPLIFVFFELPVYRESGCQQQNSVIVCMFTQDYAFSNWSQSYPPLSNTTLPFNQKHTEYFPNSPEFFFILVHKGPMRFSASAKIQSTSVKCARGTLIHPLSVDLFRWCLSFLKKSYIIYK